jgi:hypothetical protein
VPSPGLIELGTVDSGLDAIAAAGDDFDLTITALDWHDPPAPRTGAPYLAPTSPTGPAQPDRELAATRVCGSERWLNRGVETGRIPCATA